jgi:hypothetical protein
MAPRHGGTALCFWDFSSWGIRDFPMRLISHASQESLEYLWENPYYPRISMGISHTIHIFYIIFNGKIMECPMQAMFDFSGVGRWSVNLEAIFPRKSWMLRI